MSSETPSFREFGSGTIRVKASVPIVPIKPIVAKTPIEIMLKNHKREEWLTVKHGHDLSVVQEFDFPPVVRHFCLLLAFKGPATVEKIAGLNIYAIPRILKIILQKKKLSKNISKNLVNFVSSARTAIRSMDIKSCIN